MDIFIFQMIHEGNTDFPIFFSMESQVP